MRSVVRSVSCVVRGLAACAAVTFAAIASHPLSALALAPVELDLREIPAQQTSSAQSCNVIVGSDVPQHFLRFLGADGMGVAGDGADDTRLDGAERVRVRLLEPSSSLAYDVLEAGNENGGAPGEASLVGLDEAELPLAPVAVSGVGTIDVSAHYPATPLLGFTVEAAGDSQRLGRVRWRPDAPTEVAVSLRSIGTLNVGELDLCGARIVGSFELGLQNGLGMGVSGWFSNNLIDGDEWIDVFFDPPREGLVLYSNGASDNDTDGTSGEGALLAWDASGNELPQNFVDGFGHLDVAAMHPAVSVSRVRYAALDGDGRRFSTIEFVPEPAQLPSGAVAFAACAALAALRRRRG